ncbi:hypothetical protein, partial [Hwanghaeella sp. LZ110]|uniref:hypothetical protein n=1 Tax=Hwanghaeella sp. LZ110 TaxID=3402810 RepID=UPI003B680AA4
MQYYFPDIGEYWHITFIDGSAQAPEKYDGTGGKPEVYYEMITQTLRAMATGEISGLQAYQQRRLKLKASFS